MKVKYKSNVLITALLLFACNLSAQDAAFKSPFQHPKWSSQSNIYEVNLRQYSASGSIKDFEKHLARLKKMGVEILWFMPITPIGKEKRLGTLGSYYACSSYTAINPEFGTMDDFISLVQAIHSMGMTVIIDWVANHTSWDNAWISNKSWYQQDAGGNIISPVNTGWFHDTGTKLCAARLYTSSGCTECMTLSSDDWSVRSPSTNLMSSTSASMRSNFFTLLRRTIPKTS